MTSVTVSIGMETTWMRSCRLTGFDSFLNGGLHGILIAGIGVDHIPFCCFRHGCLPSLGPGLMMPLTTRPPMASKTQMKTPTTSTQTRTISVLLIIWLLVGHTTFFSSLFISRKQLADALPGTHKDSFPFCCFCHCFHPFRCRISCLTSSRCERCASCRICNTSSFRDGQGHSSCSSWCCSFSACTRSI